MVSKNASPSGDKDLSPATPSTPSSFEHVQPSASPDKQQDEEEEVVDEIMPNSTEKAEEEEKGVRHRRVKHDDWSALTYSIDQLGLTDRSFFT